MVKFNDVLELQKIPEWYNMYLNYKLLNKMTTNFKDLEKQRQLTKLPGYYILL